MRPQANCSLRRYPFEPWLACSLVALKCWVLANTWGNAQGFDAPHWLAVLRATRWFEPLAPPRALLASYHPPLSYLLGRVVAVFVPNDIAASQVLSTLSIIGAFLAFRRVLHTIGVLSTLTGLVLLYGSFSIPLLVWLAVETGYDGLVFFWFMLALAQSIQIYWNPPPERWWLRARFCLALTWLGLIFAAGMLTKFNSLLAIGLPFLIILVRHGINAWRRNIAAAVLPVVFGVVVVAPLYLHRYYIPEGHRVPAAMDWQRPLDLATARSERDAAPVKFIENMLKPPASSILVSQYPVVDSFAHSAWLQTWKRDGCLGTELEPALSISNFYILAFPIPLLVGTFWFLLRQPKLSVAWRHLGRVLFAISCVYCVSALAFAWGYPLWDWRVFKAKYMTPAILWIPFAAITGLDDLRWTHATSAFKVETERLILGLLVSFLLVNHLLPVY